MNTSCFQRDIQAPLIHHSPVTTGMHIKIKTTNLWKYYSGRYIFNSVQLFTIKQLLHTIRMFDQQRCAPVRLRLSGEMTQNTHAHTRCEVITNSQNATDWKTSEYLQNTVKYSRLASKPSKYLYFMFDYASFCVKTEISITFMLDIKCRRKLGRYIRLFITTVGTSCANKILRK